MRGYGRKSVELQFQELSACFKAFTSTGDSPPHGTCINRRQTIETRVKNNEINSIEYGNGQGTQLHSTSKFSAFFFSSLSFVFLTFLLGGHLKRASNLANEIVIQHLCHLLTTTHPCNMLATLLTVTLLSIVAGTASRYTPARTGLQVVDAPASLNTALTYNCFLQLL